MGLFSVQPNCIWNFLTHELILLVLRPAQFSFSECFHSQTTVSWELSFRINEATSVVQRKHILFTTVSTFS